MFGTTCSAWPGQGVTVAEAMDTVRYAIGGDNILNIKRDNGATVALALQYSPEYIDTVEKVRRTPVVTAMDAVIALG